MACPTKLTPNTRFEVWEPGAYPQAPQAEFELIELPDRYETLLLLAGREPVFVGAHEAITREAVGELTGLYRRLRERRAADADVLRDFCLQSVWCMFAEASAWPAGGCSFLSFEGWAGDQLAVSPPRIASATRPRRDGRSAWRK